jgi:hypothetical protein
MEMQTLRSHFGILLDISDTYSNLSPFVYNDLPSFSRKVDACIVPADLQVFDKFAY